MALSNCDTLAINEKGESTNGVFVSPLGVTVEFYKNWLYLSDPSAWSKGGRFTEPTVMEIQSGELTYKDVKIKAKRGPQSGVYAIVHSGYSSDGSLIAMAGCGVYGYDGDEWSGVLPQSVEYLRKTILYAEAWEVGKGVKDAMRKSLKKGVLRFNQGDAFFASALGMETPATEVCDANSPIIEEFNRG